MENYTLSFHGVSQMIIRLGWYLKLLFITNGVSRKNRRFSIPGQPARSTVQGPWSKVHGLRCKFNVQTVNWIALSVSRCPFFTPLYRQRSGLMHDDSPLFTISLVGLSAVPQIKIYFPGMILVDPAPPALKLLRPQEDRPPFPNSPSLQISGQCIRSPRNSSSSMICAS